MISCSAPAPLLVLVFFGALLVPTNGWLMPGLTSHAATREPSLASCAERPQEQLETVIRSLDSASSLQSAFAALCVVIVAVCVPRGAAAAEPVDVYFGQGCFWHVQHDLIQSEKQLLHRGESELTAVSGYAGGGGAGRDKRVCYLKPGYAKMGHAEVVRVSIPTPMLQDFSRNFFESAARELEREGDEEVDSQYRLAIGVPGGTNSELFKDLQSANGGRLRLIGGRGGDGGRQGDVFVYDTARFPFYQAELYHQFHDDTVQYGAEYHQLKDTFQANGRLKAVDCPDERV